MPGRRQSRSSDARPRPLNVPKAYDRIAEAWRPHVAARVNSQEVRIAKIDGPFDWHFHADSDEAFFVVKGAFTMRFRDDDGAWEERLAEGDLIVVPAGLEHMPVSESECWIMMIENAGTLNTGNVETAKTQSSLPDL